MKKAFGRLKTIGGEENIVAGCVICEENPDPSSYTELVGVEPKLEIVGKKYDASSQSVSEESFLPVYKGQIESQLPSAKEKVKSWTEAYDMAVELGSSAEVVADLLAKKNEAVSELQALLVKWQEAE